MRWWPKRHKHEWVTVGYGGAGWFSIRCETCGERDIAPGGFA
jgi:hypothetical protein